MLDVLSKLSEALVIAKLLHLHLYRAHYFESKVGLVSVLLAKLRIFFGLFRFLFLFIVRGIPFNTPLRCSRRPRWVEDLLFSVRVPSTVFETFSVKPYIVPNTSCS